MINPNDIRNIWNPKCQMFIPASASKMQFLDRVGFKQDDFILKLLRNALFYSSLNNHHFSYHLNQNVRRRK